MAHAVAVGFLSDYPGARALAYKFRKDVAELYPNRADEPALQRMKAAYWPVPTFHNGKMFSGRVDVVLEKVESREDFLASLRHEVLGHFGVNTFTPAEKRSLLDGIIAARDEPSMAPLWKQVERQYQQAPLDVKAEEVFALHCEGITPEQHKKSLDLVDEGQDAFRSTCITRERPMRYEDLQKISGMVAQGLHDKTRRQQTFTLPNQTFRKDDMEQKKPFHEVVAAKLIEQLKAGTAPWQKSWQPGVSNSYLPMNPTTGKRYKGINAIHLMAQGYDDARWLTYKQASAMGAQVRKGEKGTAVQYWKFEEEREKLDSQGKPVLDAKGKPIKQVVRLERPRVFFATVFNAQQMDGMPPLQQGTKKEQAWDTHERAEHILKASGANIQHVAGNRAFYRPSTDSITLPERSQFPTADNYYATALHELGHWTGHPSRLDRDLAHPFGSEGYAKEELRAEIASMIVGDELGLGHDPGQHVAYVASWIKALEDEPLEVFRAAADAEKIHDYVLAFEQKQVQEKEQTQVQQSEQHYSDLTIQALVENHGWEVAYTGLQEPGRVDSVKRSFEGLGPQGGHILPNGERSLYAGYHDDAENRRYITLKLGDQVIGDADGRDQNPQEIARQINAKAEQYADERRVKNGLEPIYSTASLQTEAKEPHELTLEQFASQATAQELTNHGRKWEVKHENYSAFSDAATSEEAIADAHRIAVNNALFHNTPGSRAAGFPAVSFPPSSVLEQYPDLVAKFPDATPSPQESVMKTHQESGADLEQAAKIAREKEAQVQRDPNKTVEDVSAAKEARISADAASLQAEGDKQQRAQLQGEKADERTYIAVPYKEKEQAKSMGAKWDRGQQSWYVPPGQDTAPFAAKWAVKEPVRTMPAPESTELIRPARTYLAVPYEERAQAKAAGAMWDKVAKSWYAGPRADMVKLEKWNPENVSAQQTPAMSPREEFAEEMRKMGLLTGEHSGGDHPIMDGKRHRVPVEGGKRGALDGFYIGHLDGHPAGRIINNKTGTDLTWKSKGYSLSDQDRAALQAQAVAKLVERDAEQTRLQLATANRVQAQMRDLQPITQLTPYLDAKGIELQAGVMTDRDAKATYVPAYDADGKQWSMQYIQEDGTKRFAKDSKKEGCFHPVGGMEALAAAPAIVIAEGYATAAQVSQAVGHATVAAFDSGNLPAVAKALHEKYPDKPIIIAGDDDRSQLMTHGGNPGREKALEAAEAVGGTAVFPTFAPGENSYPADLPKITPDAYKAHLRASHALQTAPSDAPADELAKHKAALLADEQMAALSQMKRFTDFNDLAQKSSLGAEGMKRQILTAVDQAHKKSVAIGQEDKLAHKNEQRLEPRPRRAVKIG